MRSCECLWIRSFWDSGVAREVSGLSGDVGYFYLWSLCKTFIIPGLYNCSCFPELEISFRNHVIIPATATAPISATGADGVWCCSQFQMPNKGFQKEFSRAVHTLNATNNCIWCCNWRLVGAAYQAWWVCVNVKIYGGKPLLLSKWLLSSLQREIQHHRHREVQARLIGGYSITRWFATLTNLIFPHYHPGLQQTDAFLRLRNSWSLLLLQTY